MRGDILEVNEGKSVGCDRLSLRSVMAEGNKLSRLASGKKLVSLVEKVSLDCIVSALAWLTTASLLNKMC